MPCSHSTMVCVIEVRKFKKETLNESNESQMEVNEIQSSKQTLAGWSFRSMHGSKICLLQSPCEPPLRWITISSDWLIQSLNSDCPSADSINRIHRCPKIEIVLLSFNPLLPYKLCTELHEESQSYLSLPTDCSFWGSECKACGNFRTFSLLRTPLLNSFPQAPNKSLVKSKTFF